MKRAFACIIVIIMLSTVTPVYAETEISYFNVDQYFSRSYTTTDWLNNNSYKYWYRFRVEATLLEFNPPSSLTTSVCARPIGLDGTLYGTRFPIYCPHTTNWTANSSGRNAQTARFKVQNVLSVDHNFHTSTMTVPTSCFWGIKKTS